MSRLSIDFAARRRLPPGLRWLLAALALGAGLASAHAYLGYRGAAESWELAVAEQAGASQLQSQQQRDDAGAAREDDTATQLRHLRAMHGRLDVAWIALFTVIEALHRNDVAMLSLSADAATGALAIDAEARDAKAMQDYLAELGTGGYLARVHLVSQLRAAQAPGGALRFTAQAAWPALPRVAVVPNVPGRAAAGGAP